MCVEGHVLHRFGMTATFPELFDATTFGLNRTHGVRARERMSGITLCTCCRNCVFMRALGLSFVR